MAVKPVMVGERIKRREDPRLIRGLATYTDDIKLYGMLHAAFVRSQHAAGRLTRVDTSKALARSGVVAVYTIEDIRDHLKGATWHAVLPGMNDVTPPLLAERVVRYVGQPIAVVIATDRYLARDAALDVDVDIEPTPAVVDAEQALEPNAPRVYEQFADNLCYRMGGKNPTADQLFKAADGTVSLRLVNHRVAPVSMEPRAVLAQWEEGPGKLTLWTSTQTPHGVKQQLSRSLGIPDIRIRVIAPEVGGGFGCKIPVYPEECLLSVVSRKLRRPVKWAETRTENLLNTTHGRGHVDYVDAAYRSNGEVTAVRAKMIVDVGAYPSMYGPAVPTFAGLLLSGCYRLQAVSTEIVTVYTNTMATEAYRGAGRPEAAYMIERVMDAVAAALNVDVAKVRRQNFIPPDAFPYSTATGASYDSANYEPTLDKALQLFDYAGARRAQAEAQSTGNLVGIGLATFTEICALGPSVGAVPEMRQGYWESAGIRVEPTGNVVVMTGASPHGQGQETAFAQIVADAFAVGIDDVVVVHGDTDVVTHGVGTFGSRGLVVGGTAVCMALDKITAKAKRIAAHLLDTTEDQVVFKDGEFTVPGAERKMSFRDVALAAHVWNVPIAGEEPGLEAVARFEPTGTTFPFAAHICQVAIDRETGELTIDRYVAVDDCGTIINPMLVDGQVLGGIIQGLGQAICEEVRYDEQGQLLTGTLMDYAMPKAHMFPRIELDETRTPSPLNPLGAKGIGELGTIGSTPCVVSAVLDALRPLGVTHIDMPVKPERIWTTIHNAEGRGS